jgi:DNA-binding beta-propeller fold protein YncE
MNAHRSSRFQFRALLLAAALIALASITGIAVARQTAPGSDPQAGQNLDLPNQPNSYHMTADFISMPPGRVLGSTNAINVDSQGHIWVFERCGVNSCSGSDVDPILEFDASGKFIHGFGAGKFVFPHGIIFAPDGNMWIIDAGVEEGKKGSQIFKYTPGGKLLLSLGKPGIRAQADSPDLFNEPSDLVIAPNGDLYIADGHIAKESNGRIVHLDKNGKFIEYFGTKGSGPGQFDCPHSITLDSKGRIFVADRNNDRLQILSPQGKFIAEWRQFGRPSGVRILGDTLYVADSESRNLPGQYGYNPRHHRGISIGSVKDGVVKQFIPDPHPNGGASFPEGIYVDPAGVIWGASIGDRQVTKFTLAR